MPRRSRRSAIRCGLLAAGLTILAVSTGLDGGASWAAPRDLGTLKFGIATAPPDLTLHKIQAFVTGTLKGTRWAVQHPEDAVMISLEVLPDTPRADVSRILKQFASTNYFNLNGDVSRKAWDFTIKTLVAFKLLEKPVAYDQSVETQYARNAVKTLE